MEWSQIGRAKATAGIHVEDLSGNRSSMGLGNVRVFRTAQLSSCSESQFSTGSPLTFRAAAHFVVDEVVMIRRGAQITQS